MSPTHVALCRVHSKDDARGLAQWRWMCTPGVQRWWRARVNAAFAEAGLAGDPDPRAYL